jgi:hypothetical protein
MTAKSKTAFAIESRCTDTAAPVWDQEWRRFGKCFPTRLAAEAALIEISRQTWSTGSQWRIIGPPASALVPATRSARQP